jgi:hypothetical protein
MKVFPYFLHFSSDLDSINTDFCNNTLSDHEFCADQCSKNHTLLREVNGFLSVLPTFIARFE